MTIAVGKYAKVVSSPSQFCCTSSFCSKHFIRNCHFVSLVVKESDTKIWKILWIMCTELYKCFLCFFKNACQLQKWWKVSEISELRLYLKLKGKIFLRKYRSYNTVALNINFNSEKGFQKYKFQWVQVESEIKTFFLKQS